MSCAIYMRDNWIENLRLTHCLGMDGADSLLSLEANLDASRLRCVLACVCASVCVCADVQLGIQQQNAWCVPC